MNKRDTFRIGQGLKFLVDVTDLGTDVTLDDIAYTLKVSSGAQSKSYAVTMSGSTQTRPSGVVRVNEHSVILAVDTTGLDRGNLFLNFTADVTDASFPMGTRHEDRDIDLMTTLE